MPEIHLGVDIGSTAIKVVAVDDAAERVVAVTRQEYERRSSGPGRLEIAPDALVGAVIQALAALPAEVRARAAALAFSGQMCGLIGLDARRRPVGDCLSIFDARAVGASAELLRDHGAHLAAHEGNRPFTIHTLPKLLWVRRHEPERYAAIRQVVLPKDYVRGVLTGEWHTDPSDASGTLAYDQATGQWDTMLLDQLGIPARLWPEVRPSAAVCGALDAASASAAGLPSGIPVVNGAADMAAAALGAGATGTGDLVVSVGTAAHLIGPVDRLDPDAWPAQQYTAATGGWYRFGAVLSGGRALEWVLDATGTGFGAIAPAGPPVADTPLFVPYLAGAGAPHYVADAGGAFLGLRAEHGGADLVRAVIEGLCLEIAEVRGCVDPDGGRNRIVLTGGAGRVPALGATLATVLGRDIAVTRSPEAAGVGAALLARAGAAGTDAAPRGAVADEVIAPDPRAAGYFRDRIPRYAAAAAAVRGLAGGPAPQTDQP